MTFVSLFYKNRVPQGFKLSGHSTESAADLTGKTVCSAVSSAAYMAANTVLEIIKDECEVSVDDAEMSLYLKTASEKSVAVLEGFFLHITELAKQYPDRIKIITEV